MNKNFIVDDLYMAHAIVYITGEPFVKFEEDGKQKFKFPKLKSVMNSYRVINKYRNLYR